MHITRYALIYGALTAAVTGGISIATLIIWGTDNGLPSEWFGYLVIFVACALVFVGMRQYRDVERGGVIRFWPAFGVGVAIALVGAFAHAVLWEIYMAVTQMDFVTLYIESIRKGMAEAGASPADIAAKVTETESMRSLFENPLTRFPIVMLEPIPVSVPVALLSAALLRNPKFLPARQA